MAKRKSSAGAKVPRKQHVEAEAQVEQPAMGQSLMEKSKLGFSSKWRWLGIVVLVLFVFYLTHKPRPQGVSTPQSSASRPIWGQELKLELVSKFDAPGEVLDIKADAGGNVYVLQSTLLQLFSSGKVVKTMGLAAGNPMRSMAFDGKYFFVTDFSDGGIVKIDKGLITAKGFGVAGASRLLGAAVSLKNGDIYFSEVGGGAVFAVDASGSKKFKVKGPSPEGVNGFILDLQVNAAGELIQTDLSGRVITKMGRDGKVRKLLRIPFNEASYERAAIVGNKIYMNCFKDRYVAVMTMEGEPIGFIKKDSPQMIGVGLDGFLYLKNGDNIEKLKPLSAEVEMPAKAAVLPKALTKTAK